MRTTLTLDDDVAAVLERLRKRGKTGLKQIINEALRRGLPQMTRPDQPGEPYQTRANNLGRCLLGSIDDVAEALSVAEGEIIR